MENIILKNKLLSYITMFSFVLFAFTAVCIAQNQSFPDSDWTFQKATPQDIHIFDAYIGKFRSNSQRNEQLGKNIYFIVEYAWFDQNKSIVKFRLSYVIEDENKELLNAEGFYGFDPFENKLFHTQVFTFGSTAFGGIQEFDLDTNRRVTRARSKGADGAVTDVRDVFEVIDENTWKNTTHIRQGDGEWTQPFGDTFTRIVE